jgi:hypothetical protein
MTVLITLTTAGTDSGPFDLYSDLDGYTSAFESGVSKASLLAGYASALVPDYTNIIRVKSNGDCVNYIDIPLPGYTTTTTTTTIGLAEGIMSATSHPTDACPLSLSPSWWLGGTGTIGVGGIVYTDSLGTTPFVGDGDFYKLKLLSSPTVYSAPVDSFGAIGIPVNICP